MKTSINSSYYNYQSSTNVLFSILNTNNDIIYKNSDNNYTESYLSNGEEFYFNFYHQLPYNILCKITIQGNEITGCGGIVIRPYQTTKLECDVVTKRKFVFNTYEISNDKESLEAIIKNGEIKVEFFREKPKYDIKSLKLNNDYTDNILKRTYTNNYYNITCDTLSDGFCASTYSSNSLQTGKIEQGDISTQNFVYVDMDFEKFPFETLKIKMLPKGMNQVKKQNIIDIEIIKSNLSSNKNDLSLKKDNTYYLNNCQKFEVVLKNISQQDAFCYIEYNGDKTLPIKLRNGERVYISNVNGMQLSFNKNIDKICIVTLNNNYEKISECIFNLKENLKTHLTIKDIKKEQIKENKKLFCTECGESYNIGDKFCKYCGNKH